MSLLEFDNKLLEIPNGWTIHWNHFVELEPDNEYPIDEVFWNFDEDTLYATYNNYKLDLGFYGGYLNNRQGFFRIDIFVDDFNNGGFYERFISRKTKDIQEKLNYYFKIISEDKLNNLKPLQCEDFDSSSSRHIFSVIDNLDYYLTEDELNKIAQPKNE